MKSWIKTAKRNPGFKISGVNMVKNSAYRVMEDTGFGSAWSEVVVDYRFHSITSLYENREKLVYNSKIGALRILDESITPDTMENEAKWHSIYDGHLDIVRGPSQKDYIGVLTYFEADEQRKEFYCIDLCASDRIFEILHNLDYSKFEVQLCINYRMKGAQNMYSITGDVNLDVKKGSQILIDNYSVKIAPIGQRQEDWNNLCGAEPESEKPKEYPELALPSINAAINRVGQILIIGFSVIATLIFVMRK